MPILKNKRYENFEHSTPRDAFCGVPLQRFPWLLEEKTSPTLDGRLHWQIKIYCLSATPSGFGAKLNLTLYAEAELNAESACKIAFPEYQNNRIEALFGNKALSVEDSLEITVEGRLEDLRQQGSALLKKMIAKLGTDWPPERIQAQLRGRLQNTSPGGFGQSGFA